MPPTVELEEARSGAAGRQALWHAVRLTWHGQKWAGSGSRMQRGSTVGLPGVAGRSWPCPPLDLLRSPAGGVESTRFPKCVLPLSLPFFSALRDRHRTWMGTWRRSVSMCPCRCGSERARHGRMAGTRAKTRDGRRRGRRKFPVRPVIAVACVFKDPVSQWWQHIIQCKKAGCCLPNFRDSFWLFAARLGRLLP